MNALEKRLSELNPGLLSDLNKTVIKVEALLREYKSNFPTYTDHSISHTREVFNLASRLLTIEEINNLNDDEIYILSMASYLHDIGMCIPANRIEEIGNTEDIIHYKKTHPDLSAEDFIRNIHHELSNKFILEEWEALNIPDENYAKAIGLVAMGHRKVELDDIEIYDPNFFVKSGGREDFVCLPFLASVLRIADELDITNIRTPNLLTKYYKPEIEKSRIEWEKHIATTKINFKLDQVTYEVKCSNQNMLAALNYQFDKIRDVISSCQKVIRGIGIIEGRNFKLTLTSVVPKFSYVDNFKPEGIKFSFNVKNVISAFIGEDLYQDRLTALREAIQNSIDSCRYKYFKLKNSTYTPNIKVYINDELIRIEDNGMGMDKFIIENYFGKLANSFYAQDKIKNEFEAIGQFGVGVFSYFLIAEYLEIETKTENGDVQKFLIDKDPDNYFHFFNKAERNESGTTITLYLKKTLLVYINMNN
jgi:molecular chaperone HtpG